MADVTSEEFDECTRIIDAMWGVEVADRGYGRRADHAAGMLLSGSAFQSVAPGEILDLVNRAIRVGYMEAVKDVQSGILGDDILNWRPDIAEG